MRCSSCAPEPWQTIDSLADSDTELNQQPVALDLNSQVLSHPNHVPRKGAVLAVHNTLAMGMLPICRWMPQQGRGFVH